MKTRENMRSYSRIRKNLNNKRKGFTLVELIVVLVVLAIIASVAVPALMGYVANSKDKKLVAKAEGALGAAQTALTELYNEGGNKLTANRRIKAKQLATADGSTFEIVTGETLVDRDNTDAGLKPTAAVTDNIAAYTIVKALYISSREDESKYLYYDGSDWSVYENEEAWKASDQYNDYADAKLTSGLRMWDFDESDTDSAYQPPKTAERDPYVWDQDTWTIEKTVVLHNGVDTKGHGLLFAMGDYDPNQISALDSQHSKNEIEVKFTLTTNGTSSTITDTTWSTVSTVGEYTLLLQNGFRPTQKDDGGLGDVLWATSADATEGYSYAQIKEAIESGESFTKLYPLIKKEVTKKEVTFKSHNPSTLYFGSEQAPEYERTVTFYKYANEWDTTYADNDGLTRSDMESVLPDRVIHHPENCSLAGWAREMSDGTYQFRDGTEAYKTQEELWTLVFTGQDTDNLVLVGNIATRHEVLLLSGNRARFFQNLTKLDLYVVISELSGEIIEDNFNSYFTEHNLNPSSGYRLDGWQDMDDPDHKIEKKDNDAELYDIRDYVKATKLPEYTFEAVTKKASRAKFIARSDGSNNTQWNDLTTFVGQMRQLSNANKRNTNFTALIHLSYADGIGFLKQNGLLSLVVQNPNEENILNYNAIYTNKHCMSLTPNKVVADGTVKALFVLWDGNDPTYSLPMFAYNIVDSSGKVKAYWFTQEGNPELEGSNAGGFKGLFDNYYGLDLSQADLETWNTAECTDMENMFFDCRGLSGDAVDFSKWDFGSVKNMKGMFQGCTGLTHISLKGISAPVCTTCESLFQGCNQLTNINLEDSSFAELKTLKNAFYGCSELVTLNLDKSSMPKLTSIETFLSGTNALATFSARGWDARSLKSLKQTFQNRTALTSFNIQNYDSDHKTNLSGVTNIESMLSGCTKLTSVSFEGVDFSAVTSMNNVMSGCSGLKTVTFNDCDMSGYKGVFPKGMFPLNIEVFNARGWDISQATSFKSMFGSDGKSGTVHVNILYEDLSVDPQRKIREVDFTNAKMGAATSTGYMFANCANIEKITFKGADLHSIDNMEFMFFHCVEINSLNLEFDGTISPRNMQYFCDFCWKLKELKFGDFNTASVESFRNFFYNCQGLGDNQKYFETWDYSSATTLHRMLNGTRFKTVTFKEKDMPNLTTMQEMFRFSEIEEISFIDCKMDKLSTVYLMFTGSTVRKISFNGTSMKRPDGVSSFGQAFAGCYLLESFSGVDWKISSPTAKTSMEGMFNFTNLTTAIDTSASNKQIKLSDFVSLTSVDLTNADLSGVSNVKNLFNGNNAVGIVKFGDCNMSGVTTVQNMFAGTTSLTTLSAKGWKLSSMTSLEALFKEHKSLMYVYLTGADFKACKNMKQMFFRCTSLIWVEFGIEEGEPVRETAAACNCYQMFAESTSLAHLELNICIHLSDGTRMFNGIPVESLNLTHIDFSGATNLSSFFRSCESLTSVTFPDATTLGSLTTVEDMLYGCTEFTMDAFQNMFSNWDLSGCRMNFSATGGKEVTIIATNTPLFTEERTYTSIDGTYKLGPINQANSRKLKRAN